MTFWQCMSWSLIALKSTLFTENSFEASYESVSNTTLESAVPIPSAEYSLLSEAVYTDIPQDLHLVVNGANNIGEYSYIGQDDTLNLPDTLVQHGAPVTESNNQHEVSQIYEDLASIVSHSIPDLSRSLHWHHKLSLFTY